MAYVLWRVIMKKYSKIRLGLHRNFLVNSDRPVSKDHLSNQQAIGPPPPSPGHAALFDQDDEVTPTHGRGSRGTSLPEGRERLRQPRKYKPGGGGDPCPQEDRPVGAAVTRRGSSPRKRKAPPPPRPPPPDLSRLSCQQGGTSSGSVPNHGHQTSEHSGPAPVHHYPSSSLREISTVQEEVEEDYLRCGSSHGGEDILESQFFETRHSEPIQSPIPFPEPPLLTIHSPSGESHDDGDPVDSEYIVFKMGNSIGRASSVYGSSTLDLDEVSVCEEAVSTATAVDDRDTSTATDPRTILEDDDGDTISRTAAVASPPPDSGRGGSVGTEVLDSRTEGGTSLSSVLDGQVSSVGLQPKSHSLLTPPCQAAPSTAAAPSGSRRKDDGTNSTNNPKFFPNGAVSLASLDSISSIVSEEVDEYDDLTAPQKCATPCPSALCLSEGKEDVAGLVDLLLVPIYIAAAATDGSAPAAAAVEAIRRVLVRQARDVLVCSFLGDLKRFRVEFCLPAAKVLQRVKSSVVDEIGSDAVCPRGWPLSVGRGVLCLRLGELDPSLLRRHDCYLCVRTRREGASAPPGVEVALVWKAAGRPAPISVPLPSDADLAETLASPVAMEAAVARRADSEEGLACLLQSLLVSVERAVERIPLEDLAFPCRHCLLPCLPDPACCDRGAAMRDDEDGDAEESSDGEDTEVGSTIGRASVASSAVATPVIHAANMFCFEGSIPHIDSDADDVCADEEIKVSMELVAKGGKRAPIALPEGVTKYPVATNGCPPSESVIPARSVEELPEGLLMSGIQLPGTRDIAGRPLILYEVSSVQKASLDHAHVASVLLYYGSVPRAERAREGFTVLVLFSSSEPSNISALEVLDQALAVVKTHSMRIGCVLVWVPRKETVGRLGRMFPVSEAQHRILGDSLSMRRYVAEDQLPAACGGKAPQVDQAEWVEFQKEVESLLSQCQRAGRRLVDAMWELRGDEGGSSSSGSVVSTASSGGGASDSGQERRRRRRRRRHLQAQHRLVTKALGDSTLARLRRDGPAALCRIEEMARLLADSEDVRCGVGRARMLFAEVSRAARRLEQLGERRRERLRALARLRALQEETAQVLSWLSQKGEATLKRHAQLATDLHAFKRQEQEFEKFYFISMRHLDKGSDLLEEATGGERVCDPEGDGGGVPAVAEGDAGGVWNGSRVSQSGDGGSERPSDESSHHGKSNPPEGEGGGGGLRDLARSLKQHLRGFSERLEDTRERLEDTSRCFHLLDKATEWSSEAMKYISRTSKVPGTIDSSEASGTSSDERRMDQQLLQTRQLRRYLATHLPISDHHFAEMLALAQKLGNEKLLEQCKAAHARCLETVALIRAQQPRVWNQSQTNSEPTSPTDAVMDKGCSACAAAFSSASSSASSSSSSTCSSSYPGQENNGGGVSGGGGSYRTKQCLNRSWISSKCGGGASNVNGPARRRRSVGAFPCSDAAAPPTSSDQHHNHNHECGDHHAAGRGSCPGPYPDADCLLGNIKEVRESSEELLEEEERAGGQEGKCQRQQQLLLRRSCTWPYPGEQASDGSRGVNANGAGVGSGGVNSSGGGSSSEGGAGEDGGESYGNELLSESFVRGNSGCNRCRARMGVEDQRFGFSTDHSGEDNTTEGSDGCLKSGDCLYDQDGNNVCSRRSSQGSGSLKSPIPVNSHLHCHNNNIGLQHSMSLPLNGDLGNKELKMQKTVLLIMREMIQTERDYVRSLEYVIENYIPELLREDIPQALRGQRNVIFGNIEKIYEFHSQYFLQELEQCETCPLLVGQCFLKYEKKFYLYALYNKNKPKSDSLMSEYGTTFFKAKQLELGDKMDLASYLLKPVQRMGKYALLLQQLMKAHPEKESDIADIQAAEQMVRFQLRHGNDLLAMDSLRDCDVNVKEQGRLLRQNEFLVWQGKGKKCLRHVFLFEDLILFSKARRFPDRKNLDIYIYKNSIKMTDIGLTAKIGDSPTKFEIWFRKRKPNDTFTLQSMSEEIKKSWTEEISNLLWKQALRNREMRLAEMSSMGIGNKPCLDIRPSADQINDRSISIAQLSKTPRFRNSIAISPGEGSVSGGSGNSSRRPHSIISVSSSLSSGGGSSGGSSSGGGGAGGSSSGGGGGRGRHSPFTFGALNLGFDAVDDGDDEEDGDEGRGTREGGCGIGSRGSPRTRLCLRHHRSVTLQSQCSMESGIIADISLGSEETEGSNNWGMERSNSSVTSMSLDSSISPSSPMAPPIEGTIGGETTVNGKDIKEDENNESISVKL
ncbi:uncharacterized protein LOC124162954 isoform X2 [Ischnura elegans]|uniref:uncharacterized protein LOC124162954 isoform X2 n=1 Tax=Ischnura elegans TaxID=197161 RepID=UPI001ED8B3E2|nr:uncharacterized protein LOC124162954 isoform X2 [Ischnura elegans]